jgi:hypothetical protein
MGPTRLRGTPAAHDGDAQKAVVDQAVVLATFARHRPFIPSW